MEYSFDTEQWPLVICKLKGKVTKGPIFDKYLLDWSNLYVQATEKAEKFSLVFDTTKLGHVSMKCLMAQAIFLKKTRKLTELWLDRSAILVKSSAIRRLLTVVFTIYRPVRPFKTFNSRTTALHWLQSSEEGEKV